MSSIPYHVFTKAFHTHTEVLLHESLLFSDAEYDERTQYELTISKGLRDKLIYQALRQSKGGLTKSAFPPKCYVPRDYEQDYQDALGIVEYYAKDLSD